jgi:large subunit ribosomal protein L21
MKYAIVESGGKQYVAREGQSLEVDRLPGEPGQAVDFDRVLILVEDGEVQVGSPWVSGAHVSGTVTGQIKGPKVIVFKYIPKERYRRKQGHRQAYTRVAVEAIGVGAARKQQPARERLEVAETAAEAEAPRKEAGRPKAPAAKAPAKKAAAKKTAAKKTPAKTKAPARPRKTTKG